MPTIVLHVANSTPVKVDVEEIPNPNDQAIVGMNPRERNDKEFPWVDEGVTTVIFPWWRINYVQVLPDPSEDVDFPELFRS
ncbi:MAG: hypothetical protein AAFV33_20725 [Chloroflexota bacterium]